MAKTRLTESTRNGLYEWMITKYSAEAKKGVVTPKATAIEAINKIIRAKYPESDMEVLRKYKCTRKDGCLRFVNDDGHVFGVNFGYSEEAVEPLADLPSGRGCSSNDVFPASKPAQKAIEAFTAAQESFEGELRKKQAEYRSFLSVCKHVEDVDEVVALPVDLKDRYMSGGVLVAMNPDVMESIKRDFAA